MKRRVFLEYVMRAGIWTAAVSTGLLLPKSLWAAINAPAFAAKQYKDSLKELFGTDQVADSAEVKLNAPEVAENGAKVSLTITSTLEGVESISIIIERNIRPLSAHYQFGKGMKPFINTRVKMRETSRVHAVVKAGGKLYKATKKVQVTAGGCN